MTADATGIFPIEAAAYHNDPCETPSLSSTIGRLLINKSPLHAWTAHPRLNPDWQPEIDDKFDLGTAVHSLFLQGVDNCEVVDVDEWRTNAAKEAKADIRARGLIPLRTKDWVRVEAMIDAIRRQLPTLNADPPLFADGLPEQTVIWEEDGVVCRAMCDWLNDTHAAIDDVKTTGSADPEWFTGKHMWSMGYDFQAAFYIRGVENVTGVRPDFRFLVCETHPPHAVSVVSLAPPAMAVAEAKVAAAIDLWRECLRTDTWPGYPTEVCYAELPPWEEARWLEREARA